ncbi:hypothetical protein P3X46_009829 [Hevea brasiliensis]|uniref:mRNA-decapping enzyme C-terminal domain-containing protein n=1 Tax=Hevea brasiliensis TaxID=3981 RepID=A0ABQ9MCB0_HEVBR|nr:hypothetical protein P3X46_009829 [Hevea brasiliensis]
MNRRNRDNLFEILLGDFEYEVQVPYLLYRNAAQEMNGIWFYNASECEEVANLCSSDFEELEAVPTMAVMDGPLEPPASTASNVTDLPDDPAFVNFFSTATTFGNASNVTAVGQPRRSSTLVPLPSHPASVPTATVPSLQIPSPSLSPSTPLMAILDVPHAKSTGNQTTNLVKPSSFFVPPPLSSARMMPPVSSSIPTAPLNPTVSLRCPYGAPLLQPFPPPNPPPSLTPASVPTANYGPVISKDKVRDALLVLVQDNQFIDKVYRALLNAHHS